jgi:hypothetical protein
VQKDIFTGSFGVTRGFLDSSSGAFGFANASADGSGSVILSVLLSATVETAACTADAWSSAALSQIPTLFPSVNISAFPFRSFLIPGAAGGGTCNWGYVTSNT